MKRFKWRLQRVLDIKQKEEQAKRSQLMDVTQRLSQIRAELFIEKRILRDLIDDLSESDTRDRLEKQAFFMTYSAANNAKIKSLEDKVKTLVKEQHNKMKEVVKIKQFNEGLEKLRAQAQEEFMKEQEISEQKESDQRTTISFARKAMIQSEKVVL